MMERHSGFSQLALTALVSILLTLMLGGCGFKDKPVPPQQVVPKAVTDLRYQLSEKGVTLFWSYPVETVTGDDITEIADFQLYRAVVDKDSYCDTCPIPFGPAVSLPGGALPDEGRKTATYQATLLRPGNLYFFKVRAKTGWWAQSADSNVVSFLWETPPLAPAGLQAVAGDREVTLSWSPVSMHLDNTEAPEEIKYQLYRSTSGSNFAKLGEMQDGTTYTDTTVQNGRKYYYQVQAVSAYERGTVGGGFSESAEAAPVDRTPPTIPTGVKAIRTDTGVKIFWVTVSDGDLKGYRVYRRAGGASVPEMIGEVGVPYAMFIDHKPLALDQVYYSVSSVDNRTPGNESARSPEVMLTK